MDDVRDDEILGRACFEPGHVNKTPNQRYFARSMKRGAGTLSFDRFEEDCGNVEYLCDIHDFIDAPKMHSGEFFGWHYLKAAAVRKKTIEVRPSPRADFDDEWHVDVIAPTPDDHERICSVVASKVQWYPRPTI